ncbi:ELM1/GtrOC1 family putative glycosyltransferase [Kiritimatiella glycovorans]|uniref:Nucleoside-diphosphate sugar epimerase n=1 Tax=Kiritimatiella glycovorans TaxID=1307763 RepID=A0A0G3EDN5_9BACT|nr:ELM1/GtrOC1 family putative glycosyltransferase [Kiritimatiella glycovorans]AKJ64443.1 hypothetical protein L21SP4_01195 [Kiritimatiella glycovorans]
MKTGCARKRQDDSEIRPYPWVPSRTSPHGFLMQAKALVISDGKPGHVNQAHALCRHLELQPDTIEVAHRHRFARAATYVLDRLGVKSTLPFTMQADGRRFDLLQLRQRRHETALVVSAGSATYYPNKVIAAASRRPNVAILNPGGYRLDFDRVLVPEYDRQPAAGPVVPLPINLCDTDPAYYRDRREEFLERHLPRKRGVGLIIGGPNHAFDMNPADIRSYVERIFDLTPEHEHWVTTSRRTPPEVEAVIDRFSFDFKLIYSREPYNPIPAFIALCDTLCVTDDSASMLSECASFGDARLEILPNRPLKSPNKFERLVEGLRRRRAAHVFDGSLGDEREKIDLGPILREAINPILKKW